MKKTIQQQQNEVSGMNRNSRIGYTRLRYNFID